MPNFSSCICISSTIRAIAIPLLSTSAYNLLGKCKHAKRYILSIICIEQYLFWNAGCIFAFLFRIVILSHPIVIACSITILYNASIFLSSSISDSYSANAKISISCSTTISEIYSFIFSFLLVFQKHTRNFFTHLSLF